MRLRRVTCMWYRRSPGISGHKKRLLRWLSKYIHQSIRFFVAATLSFVSDSDSYLLWHWPYVTINNNGSWTKRFTIPDELQINCFSPSNQLFVTRTKSSLPWPFCRSNPIHQAVMGSCVGINPGSATWLARPLTIIIRVSAIALYVPCFLGPDFKTRLLPRGLSVLRSPARYPSILAACLTWRG